MAEIVRAGTVLLELGEDMVQVGSSPEHSFTLLGLDPFTKVWLEHVLALRVLPSAADLSADQTRVVSLLREHGLIQVPSTALSPLRVRVAGLDRVGINLARTLTEAGVRYLDLRGGGEINQDISDLFEDEHFGMNRRQTLLKELAAPGLFLGRQTWPELAFTVEQRIMDIRRGAQYLHRDVPHLPVMVDDRSIQIGPLLVPGQTACYLCLEHHRADAIPNWANVRRQLEQTPPPPVDQLLAHTAATLAVHLLQEMLADPKGAPWSLGTSWRVTDRGVETTSWDKHPRCGCTERGLFHS